MSSPYENLNTFNSYKDRISKYISEQLVKSDGYLSFIQFTANFKIPNNMNPVFFEDWDINGDGTLDIISLCKKMVDYFKKH